MCAVLVHTLCYVNVVYKSALQAWEFSVCHTVLTDVHSFNFACSELLPEDVGKRVLIADVTYMTMASVCLQ